MSTPRIIWATLDLSTYGYNNADIYVSKNISLEIQKDSKFVKNQNFELTGSITDIRTFFNASNHKSFALITNGSKIVMLPISIDESTEKIARNHDKDDSISNNFESFDTLASSFRYTK